MLARGRQASGEPNIALHLTASYGPAPCGARLGPPSLQVSLAVRRRVKVTVRSARGERKKVYCVHTSGNARQYPALIPIRSHFYSLRSDNILLVLLYCYLFDECLLIDVAPMLRTMLPPFEQSGVSKCFSFVLFCVNQYWIIHCSFSSIDIPYHSLLLLLCTR